jgi:N-formylglutamate amidohydrolase
MNPCTQALTAVAEDALLRVCSVLLTEHAGQSPASKEAVAIQVAVLAYFRNLGSAPRDLTAAAVEQVRAACDRVIQVAYEFPEISFRRP